MQIKTIANRLREKGICGLTIRADRKTIESATRALAVNSFLGAIVGFGLMGYLCFRSEQDQKADPVTTFALAALSASSSAGAVVSFFHLRDYFKSND
jgi:ABC-type Fe3+-siderophore transport system permease subunit